MANFFDQFDAPAQPSGGGGSPFAAAISSIESGGNYRAVGPETGRGRALGRYQIMTSNIGPWSKEILGREVTPTEFMASPQLQDQIFEGKFGQYVQKYGPENAAKAWFAGERGMNNPNARDVLGTSVADYGRKFTNALPAQMSSFAAPEAGALAPMPAPAQPAKNFFDQFDGAASDTFGQRFGGFEQPQNADALRSGLEHRAREMTTGPAQDHFAGMVTDFLNQGSAASQGTTPNIGAQTRNLISAETFENDAGEVLYRDPATGQVVPTDQNKQVALRDPADGRIKVYARTAETDEGRLSSAGRLLGTGMASGAPTRLPGVAAQAAREAAPVMTPSQEVSQASQRIGVELPRAVTSDSQATQRVAGAVRNIPVAGDPLVAATSRAVQQLGDKAGEVAAGYGGGTIAGSGDAARTAIKDYIVGKSAAASSKFYDKVDELVDRSVLSPMPNTTVAAQGILSRRQAAGITEPSGAVRRIEEATTRPEGLTYDGIKDLRGYLRELKDNPSILPADLSGKELNRIYDAVTADLKGAVQNAGGQRALAAFDRANKHYALLSKRREDLARIVGANADAPAERVFDRLVSMASGTSRADIAGLGQARKAIGAEDWNEFVSGIVAQMGRSPASRGAPETLQGADFSPERFLTAYNKLSDAGRNMLFRSGGAGSLADSLKDIAAVSSRFRELQKFSNPSGTAPNILGAATGVSTVTPLLYGDVVTPLVVMGSVLSGRVLASALAKPASASSVARVARTQEALVRRPSSATLAAFNMATRNLINTLGEQARGLNPADFLRALQGPIPGRAGDENPKP